MNNIRRLSFLTAAAATILLVAIFALSAVLPSYEFPNYGYSAFMFSGAIAAFYFARRRLVCR